MTTLVTSAALKPNTFNWSPIGAQCSEPVILRYSCCFQPVSYRINSLPHLITPTLTGRSTVGMLLLGLVLPGTKVRSGMNDPNGTFMNRLLSISQTEQTGACARADVAVATASPANATRVEANRRTRNPCVVMAFLLLFEIKGLVRFVLS